MAVRPPNGGSSEPEAIEFGIAALDARIDEADVSFPATDEEILDAFEEPKVPYDAAGHTMDLARAFERVPAEEFESETELLDRLHPVFEERRANASVGVFERLRELVPF